MWSTLLEKAVGQPSSHARKHHYQFGKTLGAGAFGVVRQAKDRDTNEDVAIKVILKSKIMTPEQEKALMSEFDILSQLDFKHIVRLREWFESKDKFYMVTQLCTGGELFDRIIDHGSFTEQDAARVLSEVASAVKYLHDRNIVHRDIKPENLLYEYASLDGSAPLVLCDFGVAKELMSNEDLVMSAAGSLGYASPEVFGTHGHGKPVDIWSLGVVLYTILSGVSPFQAETPSQFVEEVRPGYTPYFYESHWRHVSQAARQLVTKMLKFDPAERLTIDEVLADPWIAQAGSNASIDLLPTVAPQLRARKRWRAAYERLQLARMLRHLQIAHEGDDEEGTTHSAWYANPFADPGSRFMQVVAAAEAQAQVDNPKQEQQQEQQQ